ncbi:MAG: hypothetical protein JXB49_01740 [Bacteroidales bacterium]|nr:hypothetical protein [Bacteroidales bacterium]
MKKLYAFCLAVALTACLSAQDDGYRTIFDHGNYRISGFGGPFMTFSSFDGQFCHMMGGGGGIMVGDFFFGGYGLGSTNNITGVRDNQEIDLDFGHGGFWFGYSFKPKKALHPAIHLQTGWGNISEEYDSDFRVNYTPEVDNVFVLNPTLELEMNFTRFFRLGVGANYRFVFGSDENKFGFKDEDLYSPGAFLAFKFGWF